VVLKACIVIPIEETQNGTVLNLQRIELAIQTRHVITQFAWFYP